MAGQAYSVSVEEELGIKGSELQLLIIFHFVVEHNKKVLSNNLYIICNMCCREDPICK